MITVRPINELFKVEIKGEDATVGLFFKQLNYMTKAHITSLCTSVEKGEIQIDALGQVFYNIKYGLKKVEGFADEKGEGYKLQFEKKDEHALTDDCVDALLATEFTNHMQFIAKSLADSILPKQIMHPMTNKPLEGVTIIPAHELKGVQKK